MNSPSPSSGSSTDEDEARESLIKEKERQQKRDERRRGKQRMPEDQRDQQDLELARRLQEQEMSIINHEETDFALAQQLQRQLEQEEENSNHGSSSTTNNVYTDPEADLAFARQLQLEEEQEERNRQNNPKPSSPPLLCWTKENDATPDPNQELIDPTPDLHQLFIAFDQQYFKGQLGSVEVKWSTRMTLCAGICEYNGGCVVIKLSEPLLKFRSREDMVNTLLHEMIHALLFIQMKIDDHDGHGPYFLREANRINKIAGTNITVYHNFHDEVKHYRRHIWKCDGPCQERYPFYGIVRRSMNRPPQPADIWFKEHQMTCGGTFTKIGEPEGFKDKNKKSNKRPVSKITDFFKDWDEDIKIVDKEEVMNKRPKQR